MTKEIISFSIMEFMVWVVEVTAIEFFNGDKTLAYNSLKETGVWDIYIDHYDTTHSLSKEIIIKEVSDYFIEYGVKIWW